MPTTQPTEQTDPIVQLLLDAVEVAYNAGDELLPSFIECVDQARQEGARAERDKSLKAIESAFYDGIEQGGQEYAGEGFNAEDYLDPSPEE